ncbi:MAG TPA: cyclopropane-fatty-acyl-phospholipid synthase family protein [Alphaproteobacteria bacterium]|nr:cyclopropane-fatty-acyl-phospholipid synthase family protein [Alphaproteobacteria bacterium]
MLSKLRIGQIAVVLPSGERLVGRGKTPGAEGTIVLHRWSVIYRLLLGGDIGLAEAYASGGWSSPDLPAFLTVAAQNMDVLDRDISPWGPVRALNVIRHLRRANSRAGSKRNIAEHYDLGNEFYRLWLDESMTYSSAVFTEAGQSLEDAQHRKLGKIVEQLALRGDEHVLEIGCGWGSLAAQIAEVGARVVGLTLSTEQLAYGRAKLEDKGLGDRIDLRLEDYRNVEGTFDRVVSIEMIEAVGERYWPDYFRSIRRCLRPGGMAVLQAITIREDRFEGYRRNPDFIQRYIFPGGMLPTDPKIVQGATDAGLRFLDRERFGESYALTLAEWRRRFLASHAALDKLGFHLPFRHLWEYYLAYSEAGLRAGLIDVALYRFAA